MKKKSAILVSLLLLGYSLFAGGSSEQNIIEVSENTNAVETLVQEQLFAQVIDDRVRLRSGPDLDSETIGLINSGNKVEVLNRTVQRYEIDGMNSHWYKVFDAALGEGWLYGAFLEFDTSFSETDFFDDEIEMDEGRANVDFVNINIEPNPESISITYMNNADTVRILDRTALMETRRNVQAYWYKVRYYDKDFKEDLEGWVYGVYIDTTEDIDRTEVLPIVADIKNVEIPDADLLEIAIQHNFLLMDYANNIWAENTVGIKTIVTTVESYDGKGTRTEEYDINGKIKSMDYSYQPGDRFFEYDDKGRLVREVHTGDASDTVITYTYSESDNKAEVIKEIYFNSRFTARGTVRLTDSGYEIMVEDDEGERTTYRYIYEDYLLKTRIELDANGTETGWIDYFYKDGMLQRYVIAKYNREFIDAIRTFTYEDSVLIEEEHKIYKVARFDMYRWLYSNFDEQGNYLTETYIGNDGASSVDTRTIEYY